MFCEIIESVNDTIRLCLVLKKNLKKNKKKRKNRRKIKNRLEVNKLFLFITLNLF